MKWLARSTRRAAGGGSALLALGLAAGLLTTPAEAATPDGDAASPRLTFANAQTDDLYGTAYEAALTNLLDTNTIAYDPAVYGHSGLTDDSVGTFIRAGGGYEQPWTRDASINSWNAGSLLEPASAANTLWAVVNKDGDGKLQVQQDEQQWDQVVWMTAAWNHYLVTGDRTFLGNAYETSQDTLAIRESSAVNGLNATYGLFDGASFFNDGISGYPAPPADATESHSIGRDWPLIDSGMFLSTNELYYSAYVSTASMAEALGRPADEVKAYRAKAAALKDAINEHFWNSQTGLYDYMLLADGTKGVYQEGSGLAFALLFGIADEAQKRSILENATSMPWGMPDTYPNFERYSDAQPGRHNAIVWPLVQGLWAKAVAAEGDQDAFARELTNLAQLERTSSGFWEMYNGNTGVVDGGWQRWDQTVKFNWGSEPDQTWSATGYLSVIYNGLFGLRFTEHGLQLEPNVPAGWGDATLTGVKYRGADLTIKLHGAGTTVSSFTVDGVATSSHTVASSLTGSHTVAITLSGAKRATDRDDDGVVDAVDTCSDIPGTVALHGCPDPERIESEDALNTGGAKTAANHTGFDGRAFIDSFGATGATSTYVVNRATSAPDTMSVTVRYANATGDARTLSLHVDGAKVRQVTLPVTGSSWDSWGTVKLDDVPVSGLSPQVSLVRDASDSGTVNVDWLAFRAPSLTVTPGTLSAARVGTTYSARLGATGGKAPYAYTLASGSLPPGLSLSPDGTVSGTPKGWASSTFTVSVRDAEDRSGRVTATLASTDTPVLLSTAAGSVHTGAPVGFAGSRFAPGERVAVSIGSSRGTVVASAQGTIAGSVAAPVASGRYQLTAKGATSQVTAHDVVVVAVSPVSVRLVVSPASTVYGKRVVATVTAPAGATGSVTIADAGRTIARGTLSSGRASVPLTGLSAGAHKVRATYLGSTRYASATSAGVTVTVVKAKASVKVSAKRVGTSAKVTVTVSTLTNGARPTGRVTVAVGTKVVKTAAITVKNKGKVTIALPERYDETVKVRATFLPSDSKNVASTTSKVVTVRRR